MGAGGAAARLDRTFGSEMYYDPMAEMMNAFPGAMDDVRIYSPATPRYLVFKDIVWPLGAKARTVLGSDAAECDMVLVGKPISPRHAVVMFHNGTYFIQDLDSAYGTFVNGRRVTALTELHVGDRIEVKPYVITFTGSQI